MHSQPPSEHLADWAIVGSMMDAAQATQAARCSAASAGVSVDGGIKRATTAASAFHLVTNCAKKSAWTVEQAALEAAQRERYEFHLEQWDVYEKNLLSTVAEGMQSGSVTARIGSLTVRYLGKIKVDDARYYSALAIYPVGSKRLYHLGAPYIGSIWAVICIWAVEVYIIWVPLI